MWSAISFFTSLNGSGLHSARGWPCSRIRKNGRGRRSNRYAAIAYSASLGGQDEAVMTQGRKLSTRASSSHLVAHRDQALSKKQRFHCLCTISGHSIAKLSERLNI